MNFMPNDKIRKFAANGAQAGAASTDILIVVRSLTVGGAERHIAQIAPGLRARGVDVSVCSLVADGAIMQELRERDVPLHTLTSPDQPTPLRVLTGAARMRRLLRTLRPKIVHFFLPEAYLVAGPVSILAGVPHRIMSRRGMNEYQRGHRGSAAAERMLHRRMHLVLGNSERVVRQLHDEEAVPRHKLGLIYNGVDLSRFKPATDKAALRSKLGFDRDELLLAKVATLISYKGHLDLVDALGQCQASLPDRWRLVLVGRDEGMAEPITARANSLGIGDRVTLVGQRHDIPDILAASDIGLLTSHQEGFSNAVIESMASGLPMIVTDVGGNAEAVRHGQDGLVVQPRAAGEIAAAVVQLAGDDDLRKRMGASAQARAVQSFALESCLDNYQALYDGLLYGRTAENLARLFEPRSLAAGARAEP